jgi:N-acetyl-anhydromuramyl-L-alanine amidase AmpD
MEFYVKDNYLYYSDGKKVAQRPAVNHGSFIRPRIIVIHYTGSNNLSQDLGWLRSAVSGVSAHLVVAKDGEVYQLLPFHKAAWHAGLSSHEGQSGVNNFSIGIENVGLGDHWPAAQVEANRAIIAALGAAYTIEDVVGHEDVAPGRKVDPGPNYPWDKVMAAPAPKPVPAPVPEPEVVVPPTSIIQAVVDVVKWLFTRK